MKDEIKKLTEECLKKRADYESYDKQIVELSDKRRIANIEANDLQTKINELLWEENTAAYGFHFDDCVCIVKRNLRNAAATIESVAVEKKDEPV